uniref:D-3-phosphoglycerate dehydrogenase n=1 Tax=Caldilinea aerophila TaxID=133453 RepID=A0A7C1JRR6_9CHLR
MSKSLNIAVIGDLFVTNELFLAALERWRSHLPFDITITTLSAPWPDEPLAHSDEVREFVGDPEEVARLVRHADVLLTHVAPVTRGVLERAERLRIIGCCRGGPVNINVAAATERGVVVVNAPARNSQAVVEFTLGVILAECRNIARSHAALARGVWLGDLYRYDRIGRELRGQTIGLIGFGAIAQSLVPYLTVFGMRILAYDPYVPAERFAALGVEPVDLPDLLARADIVSLHARVTPQTVGMMGAAQFAQMKRGAYFINTARGPLVDYDALYQTLHSGHLAGAALDCFPEEPPPADWPLLRLPNVTVTPHIAGASKDSAERGAEQVVRDVVNFFTDRPLEFCVNPAVLTTER